MIPITLNWSKTQLLKRNRIYTILSCPQKRVHISQKIILISVYCYQNAHMQKWNQYLDWNLTKTLFRGFIFFTIFQFRVLPIHFVISTLRCYESYKLTKLYKFYHQFSAGNRLIWRWGPQIIGPISIRISECLWCSVSLTEPW